MAQRNQGRIDRFAQMNKQEELIAKKRQEILEKQRTAQLAKAVAAAQELAAKLKSDGSSPLESLDDAVTAEVIVIEKEEEEDIKETSASAKSKTDCDSPKSLNSFTGKTGKITFGLKRTQLPQPVAEQPPPKVVNTFCNDGSFLENFKKILEKHEQPKPSIVTALSSTDLADIDGVTTAEAGSSEAAILISSTENELPGVVPAPTPLLQLQPPNIQQQQQQQLPPQPIPPPPPSVPAPAPPPFAFSPGLMSQGPPQMQLPAAFFHGAMPMQIHPAVAPPPPPPPPQLPLSLANLTPIYMLPPDPMQLNALQAHKEYDLNAMQKPTLNMESMQVPVSVAQVQEAVQQQQLLAAEQVKATPPPPPTQPPPPEPAPAIEQQHQTKEQETFHNDNELNCIKLPTTIESLIALVAEYGEEYEDKIRSHRSDLHPSMWFLYDKNCEQYGSYRRQLHERVQHQQRILNVTQQQEDILKEQQQPNVTIAVEQQRQLPSTSAAEKYDPESVISDDMDSDDEYMRGMMDRNRDNIKRRIESRNELSEEERMEREEAEREEEARQRRKRERKSRWGEKILENDLPTTSVGNSFGNQNKPTLSGITRNDPALLQYARLNYGSTQLSEEDWKKCEEHYKVNLLYQDMIRKRQEIDRLARSGKFKYDYDSDEDVDGGTWEHKLRTAEMEATRAWASALTKQSEGKHHIGDFLPPEELKKFMEQYEAKKNNRLPDLSDYKEYKLKEDNIGFQMLQKLGWKEGQGLGTDGAGIVDPVNKAPQRDGNQGLGVSSVAEPGDCDNEYDAYRKRMMLAYRFRPNPLNNPRRAYY